MSHEHVKTAVDALSISVVVGTIVGWLPTIAAFLAVVLTVMRMVNEWPAFQKNVRSWWTKAARKRR